MMKKILLVLALVLFVSSAKAAVQPPPPETPGGSVVSIQSAQRALHWAPGRIRQTTNAVIQVCPFEFYSSNDWNGNAECYDSNDKAKSPKWIFMENYKVEGYELASFQFVFSGANGYRHLVMYFRKK